MCRATKEYDSELAYFWLSVAEFTAYHKNKIMAHKLRSFHSNDNQKLRTPLLSHPNDRSQCKISICPNYNACSSSQQPMIIMTFLGPLRKLLMSAFKI